MFVYIALSVAIIALAIVSIILYFMNAHCKMQDEAIHELMARNNALRTHIVVAHEMVVRESDYTQAYLSNAVYRLSMSEY